jgi:hypothetical protein|eukprot:CAMPEP_0177770864 /NCGR_PEP_ID=MMETSP0491_2-20121128/11201_1 /TAXON_ID=63592 /ORGANISM="Tetraselmis chuii, Strain PLY429" /LENGTH=91 /DNA_ID=CAMNT_0019288205 /DNA_START=663 /DNA_END=938 /DNA_ORIENTATION=+
MAELAEFGEEASLHNLCRTLLMSASAVVLGESGRERSNPTTSSKADEYATLSTQAGGILRDLNTTTSMLPSRHSVSVQLAAEGDIETQGGC